MKIILLTLVSLFMAVNCYVSYKDHKLYEVLPKAHQYDDFVAWEEHEGVDFFKRRAVDRVSTVLVAPEQQKDFESFLVSNDVMHNVIYEDFEVVVEKERRDMAETRRRKSAFTAEGTADFSVYWSFAEMQSYLLGLEARYSTIQLETLAFSPEGRPIYAVKVSRNAVFGQKPIIAMETGMHAREWAAPPTSFYLLHKLVEDPVTSAELLEKVDWLIIPMQNPDGYEHSRNVARLWRQNRRNITATCIGADLNRNFAFSWRPATVTQTCGSLTYPGPFALSEPEDFQLDRIVGIYSRNIRMYLSVHTFGDMVLFPWGHTGPNTGPAPVPNRDEHIHIGNLWRNAILAATGKDYLVANSLDVFGNISGAVDDHVFGTYGVDFAYTLELTDGFGFTYPEERVFALAQETFIGYQVVGRYIGNRFG